jgi:hypothetical protein
MNNNLLPIIICVISYLLAYQVNYKANRKQEVVFVYGETCYHMHHWITSIIIAIVILIGENISREIKMLIAAVLAGYALEGLTFKDALKINEDCDKAFSIQPNYLSRMKHDNK